jgi:hypothetical protein
MAEYMDHFVHMGKDLITHGAWDIKRENGIGMESLQAYRKDEFSMYHAKL